MWATVRDARTLGARGARTQCARHAHRVCALSTGGAHGMRARGAPGARIGHAGCVGCAQHNGADGMVAPGEGTARTRAIGIRARVQQAHPRLGAGTAWGNSGLRRSCTSGKNPEWHEVTHG